VKGSVYNLRQIWTVGELFFASIQLEHIFVMNISTQLAKVSFHFCFLDLFSFVDVAQLSFFLLLLFKIKQEQAFALWLNEQSL
jgi:hypothetical protein